MSRLEWRLRARVKRLHLTATELARRLQRVGVRISIAQTSRLIKGEPHRYTHDVLRGLCEALRCGITDLLWYRPDDSQPDANTSQGRRPKLPRKVRLQ